MNRGKDLSLNTVELSAWTEPGVMMAYHGIDFDMFSHGGSTFLTEREVGTSSLLTYHLTSYLQSSPLLFSLFFPLFSFPLHSSGITCSHLISPYSLFSPLLSYHLISYSLFSPLHLLFSSFPSSYPILSSSLPSPPIISPHIISYPYL